MLFQVWGGLWEEMFEGLKGKTFSFEELALELHPVQSQSMQETLHAVHYHYHADVYHHKEAESQHDSHSGTQDALGLSDTSSE